MEKQNLINLSKRLQPWLFDRSIWLGGVVVGLVVAYIEIGRRLSIFVPIPFLILLGVLVLVAAFGG
ncbi:MAG: hypothetical protein GWN30_31990, partial [Gammaproteobacteria bacterium]|nr:hypothetical protein [Gammaproteobacteria bacterium]